MMTFEQAARACGIVAILRGVTPDEVAGVGDALYAAGIRIVEVPLNSPEPFRSIAALAARFQDRMVVGAGTVLDVDSVDRVKAAGGQISVSPDCNAEVIARAVERGLMPLPGVFTPTEAFAAVRAGARAPEAVSGGGGEPEDGEGLEGGAAARREDLCGGRRDAGQHAEWAEAGCAGFGIGSNIYKPGMSAEDVGKAARDFVAAWNGLKGN